MLTLVSPAGRVVFICRSDVQRGPNRILVETIPHIAVPLQIDDWGLEGGILKTPWKEDIPLGDVPRLASDRLCPLQDFPGHMKSALSRLLRTLDPEVGRLLQDLAAALCQHQFEAIEAPVVRLVGFGPGSHPVGDACICGMLLTARAFSLGKRFEVKWLGRLSMEVKRFLHRTSVFSAASIRFAMEGRTTLAEEGFFESMQRDFEGAVQFAIEKILSEEGDQGIGFLAGVRTSVGLIQDWVFQ